MKKWYKHLIWAGKVETVECADHHYTWSGRVPLTGTLKCMYCGKPIKESDYFDFNDEKRRAYSE